MEIWIEQDRINVYVPDQMRKHRRYWEVSRNGCIYRLALGFAHNNTALPAGKNGGIKEGCYATKGLFGVILPVTKIRWQADKLACEELTIGKELFFVPYKK